MNVVDGAGRRPRKPGGRTTATAQRNGLVSPIPAPAARFRGLGSRKYGVGHTTSASRDRPSDRRRRHGTTQDICERGDSNPHTLRRQNLNLLRLPISPLSLGDHFRRCARSTIAARATRASMARAPAEASRPRETRRTPRKRGGEKIGKKNARLSPGVSVNGGPSRIRTLDLLIKSQLLYQLS